MSIELMRRPAAGRAAWALVVLAALLYPLSLYLGAATAGSVPSLLQFDGWAALAPLLAIAFGIVGALILRHQPGHAVGLLAVIGGFLTSLSVFAGTYAGYAFSHANLLPAIGFAVWLRGWLWYPGLLFLFVMLPAVFPDGRLVSPRWRAIAWAVAIGIAAELLLVSVSQHVFGFPNTDRPWAAGGRPYRLLMALPGPLFLLPLLAAATSLVIRYRRSGGVARKQLKWFLSAVLLEVVFWTFTQAATPVADITPYYDVAFPLALMAMPLAIGVAILRHRLYDIDLVLNRGLVYTGLAAFITIAYLSVVVGAGLLVGTGTRPSLVLSVLAMAVVVLLMQPVRSRLQLLANRLVYGAAADPYAVLAELSRTAAAGDVDMELAQIAEALARGLGSQKVRVSLLLPGGQRAGSWPAGADGRFGQLIPVHQDGELVGQIEADGSAGDGLTVALTGQAGLALRTLRLSAELAARLVQLEEQSKEVAASRTRLVLAQEAERRRLERDLHDGIQQDLVVLLSKAGLARYQLERDPDAAATTLVDIQNSARHAIADLRSLARGIHPAILSSQGLVEAIDSMASRMPVGVRVDADQAVRELRYAPEIEGAAYFVVAEGLANVLKHSSASEATVSITASDSRLRIAVADDGHGFERHAVRESGLRGLRDRVEALGGRVALTSGQTGTRLDVTLPVDLGHDA